MGQHFIICESRSGQHFPTTFYLELHMYYCLSKMGTAKTEINISLQIQIHPIYNSDTNCWNT